MRVLMDEYGYDWDTAWKITNKTFNYTCHTLLPEALEVWPSKLIGELLPRHLEIIERINDQFEAELKAKGVDEATIKDMAIYTGDSVRMAFLASYGGSHVNGVAELHSQLLKDVTLKNLSLIHILLVPPTIAGRAATRPIPMPAAATRSDRRVRRRR